MIHNREKINEVKIMQVILLSLFICLQLQADLLEEGHEGFCAFQPIYRGKGYQSDSIVLKNNQTLGWIGVYNKTAQWLKLVNPEKPNYFYYLRPWGLKSFNWQGSKNIVCYQAKIGGQGTYTPVSAIVPANDLEYIQVNCSDVVNITECQANTTRLSWDELGLVDNYVNPPR